MPRRVKATESAPPLRTMSEAEKELTEELRRADDSLHLYQERLAELELQLEDWGWQRLNSEARREFSRAGLRIIADLCRIYYVKNPLIKNAVDIQKHYVFGQGVSIVAKDADVNDVIQAFLDDPKNKVELTSHQAMTLKDSTLSTEANIFLVLFDNPANGRVRVRSLPFDEINDIITDPEDRKSIRWYERVWTLSTFDLGTGTYKPQAMRRFYPDWQYEPGEETAGVSTTGDPRPAKIGEADVVWDQPVFHIKVGGLDSMRFGIPEVYAGLDWAKAVKQDLEDYATVKRALTRFATQLTTKAGPKAVAAAKGKLNTTYGADPQNMTLDTNPSPVTGSMLITAMGTRLEPFKTAGAQPDTADAHGLWLMTATALGIPITMLSGDAEAGNYATAKTLDRPTELKFANRQRLWKDALHDIFRYVIRRAIEAPGGPLADFGTVEYDDDGVWKIIPAADAEGEPRSLDIDIHFPDIVEHDPELKTKALIDAATLANGTWANMLPPKAFLQKLMQLIEFENIDEWMAKLYPEGSDDMELPAAALAAQQAAHDQALALATAAPALVPGKPGVKPRESDSLTVAAAAFRDLREAIAPILARKGVTPAVSAVVVADPETEADRTESRGLVRRAFALAEKALGRPVNVNVSGADGAKEMAESVGRLAQAVADRPADQVIVSPTVEAARPADVHLHMQPKIEVHPADVRVEHHDRGPRKSETATRIENDRDGNPASSKTTTEHTYDD